MVNSRINNSVPRVSSRGAIVNVRNSNFQSGVILGNAHLTGSPIGLLLALTYSSDFMDSSTFLGYRPNSRIS